jgi:GntR family transcriptional regulator, transcriptional repressor for pyruvate dehydrogenase complex
MRPPAAKTVNADLDFHRGVDVDATNGYLATMIGTVLESMRLLIAAEFSRPGLRQDAGWSETRRRRHPGGLD